MLPADMQVRAEDMSEAELTVCMSASQMVAEVIWQSIKSKHPDLPEFQ